MIRSEQAKQPIVKATIAVQRSQRVVLIATPGSTLCPVERNSHPFRFISGLESLQKSQRSARPFAILVSLLLLVDLTNFRQDRTRNSVADDFYLCRKDETRESSAGWLAGRVGIG